MHKPSAKVWRGLPDGKLDIDEVIWMFGNKNEGDQLVNLGNLGEFPVDSGIFTPSR